MRKLSIFIVALLTLGSLQVRPGPEWSPSAGHIPKTRSRRPALAWVANSWSSANGDYGCFNDCGDHVCSVNCEKNGSCVGHCPNCGRPTPPPVLSGTAPVERTLKTRSLGPQGHTGRPRAYTTRRPRSGGAFLCSPVSDSGCRDGGGLETRLRASLKAADVLRTRKTAVRDELNN